MRDQLIEMLGSGNESFDCVPMQGSGSFSVEAMLGSFVPKDGKVLVLSNGAYGQRAAKTLTYLKRDQIVLDKAIIFRLVGKKLLKFWQQIMI